MDTALGVALGLAAAIVFGVGIVHQAAAAADAPAHDVMRASLLVTLARSPRWLLGTGLAAVGWLLQLAALAVAPVTVVQPALAFTVVVVFVLGVRASGAAAGRREIAAVGAVTIGMVAIALTAPDAGGNTAEGIGVWITLAVISLVALVPMLAPRATGLTVLWAPAAGAAFALASIATKFLTEAGSARLVLAVVWLAVVGAASAVGGVDEMSAFHVRRPVQVVPVALSVELLVPVLLAPVLFGESWPAGLVERAVLALALIVLTAGAVILGRNPMVAGLSAGGAEG